jgi:hypothetical protein
MQNDEAMNAAAITSGRSTTDDLRSGTDVKQNTVPMIRLPPLGRASHTVKTIKRAESKGTRFVVRIFTPRILYTRAVDAVTARR